MFLCLTAQQQTRSIIVPFTLEQINYFASNFFKHNHTRISYTFQFLSRSLLIYKKERHYCDVKFSNVRQQLVQSMDDQFKKSQINFIVPKAWLWLGFQIRSHNVSAILCNDDWWASLTFFVQDFSSISYACMFLPKMYWNCMNR